MERYAPTLPVIVPRSPCTTTITMRGGRRRSRLGMTTTARGRCQRERPHMWMSTNHRGKVRVRDGVNVRNIVNNQRQRGRCVDENIIPVFFTLKPSPMHHTQHTACIQEVVAAGIGRQQKQHPTSCWQEAAGANKGAAGSIHNHGWQPWTRLGVVHRRP